MPTAEEILAATQAVAAAVVSDKAITASNLNRTRSDVALSKANRDAAALSAGAASASATTATTAKTAAEAARDEILAHQHGVVDRGVWVTETNYVVGDFVDDAGAGYVATQDNIALQPSAEGNSAYWRRVTPEVATITEAVGETDANKTAAAASAAAASGSAATAVTNATTATGAATAASGSQTAASASASAAAISQSLASTAATTATTQANAASVDAATASAAVAGAEDAADAAETAASDAALSAAAAVAAADASLVVRATVDDLNLVASTDDTPGRVLQGSGAGYYMREARAWVLKRVEAKSFRIFATGLALVVGIDAAGYTASEPVQNSDYVADTARRASLTLYTTGIAAGTRIDAAGRAISIPLQSTTYDADVATRRAMRLYTTGLPERLSIDGAGKARSIPIQQATYDADVVARKSLVLWTTNHEPRLKISAAGELASEPLEKAAFLTDRENRAPLVLFTTFTASRMTVDATGSLISSESVGSGAGTSVDVEEYTWDEGTGYEADQSLLLPPDDVIYLVIATGQSYNKGAAGGDPSGAYNTTALHTGLALMPSVGVFPDGASFSSFTDLVAPDTVEVKEPYIVEAVNYMVGALVAKFSTSVPIVAAIAARGGWNYYRLKRGSTIYAELERIVKLCSDIAVGLGKRLVVPAIFIGEGESDTSDHTDWQAHSDILQWRADIESTVKRHTGQSERVQALFYATNRGLPTGTVRASPWQVATRRLSLEQPDLFSLYGPAYGIETTSDSHPSVRGYRQLGAAAGRHGLASIFGTGRRCCDVLRAYGTSTTTITVEVYVPEGGTLTRDESGAQVGYPADPDDPAYIGPPESGDEANGRDGGWWIRDKDGLFGVVSAVVSGSNILITTSRAFHAGSTRLMYAVRPQSGSTAGSSDDMARGIFRGSVSILLAGDATKPVYDWLVPQELFL
jgi:hypothetical protein